MTDALGGADTFPKLLARNAERLGERAALREKDLGIWRETSWRACLREAPRPSLYTTLSSRSSRWRSRLRPVTPGSRSASSK